MAASSESSESKAVKHTKSVRQEWREFPSESIGAPTQSSAASVETRRATGRVGYLTGAGILFIVFTLLALVQSPRPVPYPEARPWQYTFWRYPIVVHDIKRLPAIVIDGKSPNLNAVWASPNGPDVWIAGDEGTLLHSPDGGTKWERLPPDNSQPQNKPAQGSRKEDFWKLIPDATAAQQSLAAQKPGGNASPQQSQPQSQQPSGAVNGVAQQASQNAQQQSQQDSRPAPPTNLRAIPDGGSTNAEPNQAAGTANQSNPLTKNVVGVPLASRGVLTKTGQPTRGTPKKAPPGEFAHVNGGNRAQPAGGEAGNRSAAPCSFAGTDLGAVFFPNNVGGEVRSLALSSPPSTDVVTGKRVISHNCFTQDSGRTWYFAP